MVSELKSGSAEYGRIWQVMRPSAVTAYKVFNYLINYKIGTRAIKLPIGKINVFSKLINSIKHKLWCRIIV